MAHVGEHLQLGRVAVLLARPSPAVRFGVKFGTAMTAAIWIAYASGLSWGLTIWTTVMFVTQPNQGASIKKGLMRLAGTVASGLVSIALYGLFIQQPPLMLASIAGVMALAIYGVTGPRYPYAWLTFGFTTIVILIKALEGADRIETLSFERASLSALGVVVVFLADALFWPVRAEQELRVGLAERSRRLADTLKQHLNALLSGREPGDPGPAPSSPLIQQLGLAAQARDEIGVTPARAQGLSRIALLLEALASRARLLGRAATAEPSPAAPLVRAALSQLSDQLDTALAELARSLAEGRAPEPFVDALERSLASFESERMADVETETRQAANGRAGKEGQAENEAPLGALKPVLRDVVQLLHSLEEALLGLMKQAGPANEPKAVKESRSAAAVVREWFRPDPIRLQLALRAGIAGGGVLIAMLVMGWNISEDMLPMIMAPIVAFILAGMASTRGAGTKLATGLVAGILLGWLIADLSLVFLFPHLVRMPLSLVYPFVIAGGTGYLIVRGSPLGPLGALFGMLTAILPVFISDAPLQDVDASYGLVCGLLLGVIVGLIAARMFWPRTAMQTFTERAAAQLDLCVRALRGSGGDTAGPEAAALMSAYAKQLTLLGQIHAQAQAEPVERALDDGRRGELLALTQDLFDASLGAPRLTLDETDRVARDDDGAPTPLREALHRQSEAILASMIATGEALRGASTEPGPDLADAQTALEARLGEAHGESEIAQMTSAQRADALLAHVASRLQLASRQLAVEAWLAQWHQATHSAP